MEKSSFDGFSRRYKSFTAATETLDDGLAYIKVTQPGAWMVRVEKRLDMNNADYDILSRKATLVFSLQ